MPKNNFKISDAGIRFITEAEGCVLHVYDDGSGYLTVGVGHKLLPTELKLFKKGQSITQQQSDDFLRADLRICEVALNSLVTVPLNQNQTDATLSFVFNCGGGAFAKSSVLKEINKQNYQHAADRFLVWNTSKGRVLAGLVRRRKAERALFLKPFSLSTETPDAAASSPTATPGASASTSSVE